MRKIKNNKKNNEKLFISCLFYVFSLCFFYYFCSFAHTYFVLNDAWFTGCAKYLRYKNEMDNNHNGKNADFSKKLLKMVTIYNFCNGLLIYPNSSLEIGSKVAPK